MGDDTAKISPLEGAARALSESARRVCEALDAASSPVTQDLLSALKKDRDAVEALLSVKKDAVSGRVMVMDGDNARRTRILEGLKLEGVECEGVDTTFRGFGRLHRGAAAKAPYRLLVLDTSLADIQSEELLRMIQSDGRLTTIKILLLTAGDDDARFPKHDQIAGSAPLSDIVARIKRRLTTAPTPTEAHREQPRPLVLVAEDERVQQRFIEALLTRLDYRTIIVPDGLALLSHPHLEEAAIILMDGQMPHLDGYETTQRLRAREAAAGSARRPIIALTADTSPGARQRALEAGMDYYIAKPIEIGALQSLLRRYLSGGQENLTTLRSRNIQQSTQRKDIATLDRAAIEQLRLISGGDDSLLQELTRSFLQELTERVAALRRSFPSDYKAIARIAHSLKSNAHNLGASALGERCAALEEAARLHAELTEPLNRLEREVPRTERALRELLD